MLEEENRIGGPNPPTEGGMPMRQPNRTDLKQFESNVAWATIDCPTLLLVLDEVLSLGMKKMDTGQLVWQLMQRPMPLLQVPGAHYSRYLATIPGANVPADEVTSRTWPGGSVELVCSTIPVQVGNRTQNVYLLQFRDQWFWEYRVTEWL